MSKDAFIRARTDIQLKETVEAIFEKIGINTTDAVNIFFHQVVLHQGLPFEVKIPQKKRRESHETH